MNIKETSMTAIKKTCPLIYAKPIFLSIAFLLLIGCGTTGKTRPFTLKIEHGQEKMDIINVVSVDKSKDSAKLAAVGVIPMGRFSEKDLAVIEKSIKDTIANININSSKTSGETNIYIIIRAYYVAASNNACSVMASIAWCATDENKNIIYSEQFYATAKGIIMTTIGSVKNKLQKNIVNRIARTAVNIASSDENTAAISPYAAENTYISYKAAAQTVPKSLSSFYSGPLYGYIGGNVDWNQVQKNDVINWKEYISKL